MVKNKVVKIAEGIDQIVAGTMNWDGNSWFMQLVSPGENFTERAYQCKGQPELNEDGSYDTADPEKYFGNVLPKFTGGVQNSFKILKDITFIANFDYQIGGKFFSLSDYVGNILRTYSQDIRTE